MVLIKEKENKETRNSIHFTVKIGRNHCGNHIAALNEKLPTHHNDSSFAVLISYSVLKTRAVFLLTIKIIEMFVLHTSMQGMRSTEYQATTPLKFLIIMHIHECLDNQPNNRVVTSLDGINSQLIQVLLRGGNNLN